MQVRSILVLTISFWDFFVSVNINVVRLATVATEIRRIKDFFIKYFRRH